MKYKHLDGLNEPQRQAVEQLNGPLLVVAGAGSGKTRVITHRIAHLIATGTAAPDQILAVTFTNKAAGEMKERVVDLLGFEARRVWISTFHSFCARLLRDNSEALGYKRTFSIYDEAESLALIKRIYKDNNIPDSQPSFGTCQVRISRAKEKLQTPDDFAETAEDFLDQNVSKVYYEYQRRLAQNHAFDFDDLLMKVVELFEKQPDILEHYQNRLKYILVDEYQDTNHAQYRLVNLLASKNRNLCVVGDDDQSIYAWRGADISNILDFEGDYPEAKVISLEQNYRSTQVILDAAHQVVSKNLGRMKKRLFTEKSGGDKITLLLCGDERDEAEAIVEKIRLGMVYDKAASDFAVLYRTNAQSRVIEDILRYKGLPYTIVGGVRFYERAEVKDILAYLRLLINPADNMALLRIINSPKRGVGKTSVTKLEAFAVSQGIPILEALSLPLESVGIKGKAKSELDKMVAIIRSLTLEVDKLTPQDIAARIITDTGYLRALEDEKTPEADVRAENVKEVVAGIAEYVERNESATLAGFLEEVALLADIDTWNNASSSVTLMTLHAAKGLEFDTIFLAGMEDGLFPLKRSFDEPADLEEERRLCYVGMTRAKNKLYLSMAGFRRRWGDFTGGPSMFLKDVPEELIEVERFNYWTDIYSKGARNGTQVRKPHAETHIDHVQEPEYDYDDLLPLGTSVLHDKFGHGVIVGREGSGENLMVTIRFERAGVKKIMAKYASLEIIGR
ncbi:MAG TPA: ATP-dependent DNA helicase PcrA [candidate division Zixibacteria bacterium]|nr:ATP-dependent DNA helicase PcrA [candidate division Zixibacteria bacterium]